MNRPWKTDAAGFPFRWNNWALAALLLASAPGLPGQTTNLTVAPDTNSAVVPGDSSAASTNVPGLLLTNSAAPPKSDAPAFGATNLAAINASNLLARAATNTAIVVPESVVGRQVPVYTNFTTINERNIFNPNRRPRRGPNPDLTPATQSQIDSFWLTGTWSSDKGLFAVSDGSSYVYRKVLKQGSSIGGYIVASVEPPDRVELEAGGKKIELPIGMQMRRRDNGPWERIEMSPEAGSSESSPGPSADSQGFGGRSRRTRNQDSSSSFPDSGAGFQITPRISPPVSDPGSGGSGGDALQRLLAKRQQELNTDKPK